MAEPPASSSSSSLPLLEGMSNTSLNFSTSPFSPATFPGPTGVSSFFDLPSGRTAYYLFGPEDGQKVVLVHGITIPALIYKEVAIHLAEHGFRVLAYDLHGRGLSGAPQCDHTREVYVGQLAALCDHLGWDRFHLLGSSMGGAIATLFTVKYPQKVSKLLLNAPAGLMEGLPLVGKVATLPYVGELLLNTVGVSIVLSQVKKSMLHPEGPVQQYLVAAVEYQATNSPAFASCYLSSLRHFPLSGLEEEYRMLGALENPPPILVLWGTADSIVPFFLSVKLTDFVPKAVLHSIEGGGHNSLQEQPEDTFPVVLTFFSST